MNHARLYICERCTCIFDWQRSQHLRNGTASDGSRICPCCGTEFVRKFRQTDVERLWQSVDPLAPDHEVIS